MRTAIGLGVVAVLVAIVLAGCDGGAANAGQWLVAFRNQEGAGALNDLHVEWDRAVVVFANQITPGNGRFPTVVTAPNGQSTDFSGASVPQGGSCIVTLTAVWEGDNHPNVTQWWWTENGDRVGPIHQGNPSTD